MSGWLSWTPLQSGVWSKVEPREVKPSVCPPGSVYHRMIVKALSSHRLFWCRKCWTTLTLHLQNARGLSPALLSTAGNVRNTALTEHCSPSSCHHGMPLVPLFVISDTIILAWRDGVAMNSAVHAEGFGSACWLAVPRRYEQGDQVVCNKAYFWHFGLNRAWFSVLSALFLERLVEEISSWLKLGLASIKVLEPFYAHLFWDWSLKYSHYFHRYRT